VRLLLDTQIALWWLTASPRLSKASRLLIASSPCVVSVASIWEVDLKHRLGKLPITPRRFGDEMRSAGAVILSVTDEHVLTAVTPAETHRDPFDRLLLGVAEAEHLVLLTADDALITLGTKEPHLPVRRA
jgi:PIN domain nuclease of toxin-antitoxin system